MVIIDNYAQAVELPSNLLGKFNPLFNPFFCGLPNTRECPDISLVLGP